MAHSPEAYDLHKLWKLILGLVIALVVIIALDLLLLYFRNKQSADSSATTNNATSVQTQAHEMDILQKFEAEQAAKAAAQTPAEALTASASSSAATSGHKPLNVDDEAKILQQLGKH